MQFFELGSAFIAQYKSNNPHIPLNDTIFLKSHSLGCLIGNNTKLSYKILSKKFNFVKKIPILGSKYQMWYKYDKKNLSN
jgi:hypothetical protein